MSGPPPGSQGPSQEQIAQMQAAMAAEAQRRGMTPAQFQAQQRAQIEKEAKANGMTVDQYIAKLRADAIQNHNRQQAQAQQQQQLQGQHHHHHHHHHHQQQSPPSTPSSPQSPTSQQVPNSPGAPKPEALALMTWLRSQDLKTRTCILEGVRKDMFRVKRALRAIESPAYAKAAEKPKSGLPKITEEMDSSEIFKLLPLSLLALRVSKTDPHEGHGHASSGKSKGKRVKGLWTVRIESQQDVEPDLHYVFLQDGPQWKTKLYAIGALVAVFAVIMFPLWPLKMRIGVWYLSMGMLGLIGLFFGMALFRLILFLATVFTVPPGLWLYPNLFEDVGFFDSFRPVWGWHETAQDKKDAKKAKRESRRAKAEAKAQKAAAKEASGVNSNATGDAATSGVDVGKGTISLSKRDLKASVEEAEDDEESE